MTATNEPKRKEFLKGIHKIQNAFTELQEWDIRNHYSDIDRSINSPASKFHFLRLRTQWELRKIEREVWKVMKSESGKGAK